MAERVDIVHEPEPQALTQGVTFKSVLVGLCVVVFVAAWATYSEIFVRSSRMTLSHFPLALFATFLGLLVLNRWLCLSKAELLTVVSMGLVGAMIPVEGVVGFLLGIVSSLYYFANPENQWAEYFHPIYGESTCDGLAGLWRAGVFGTG